MRPLLRLILLLGAVLGAPAVMRASGRPSWGTALRFSGSDDRVELRKVEGFPEQALTLEAWFKTDGATPEGTLVSYAVEGPCVRAFSVSRPGALEIEIGCEARVTSIDLTDGAWHFLAVTWQSEGGRLQVVVDGVSAYEAEGFRAGDRLPDGGFLVLGQRQECAGGCYGGAGAFRGVMDDVRLWSVVRTLPEIRAGAGDPEVGPEADLVLAWSFDEGRWGGGNGGRIEDRSGRGQGGWAVNRPRRVMSRWESWLALRGGDPWELECHDPYIEPGGMVQARPVTVSAGYAHGLALRAEGALSGWGLNDAGQRTPLMAMGGLVAVSAGARHSLGLTEAGRVVAWGDDRWGQVTVPPEATDGIAVSAGTLHSLALRRDGTVVGWGYADSGARLVPEAATNVVAIAAGSLFSLALRADGTVVAWGSNDYGQTAVPAAVTNAVAVAASYRHGLALRVDGTVVGWGDNVQGQAQVPEAATNVVAIAAGYRHSLALRRDGGVVGWGDDSEGQAQVPEAATNVVAIAAGGAFSLALRGDGMVLGWGRSTDGAIAVPESVFVTDAPVHVSGAVDSGLPGDYVRTYTALGSSGEELATERIVRVADSLAPILDVEGEDPLVVELGGEFVTPNAVAQDVCAGDLTSQIVLAGTVEPAVVGAYRLAYSVTDPSGNSNEVVRWVHVVAAPRIIGTRAVLLGTGGERSARLEAQIVPQGLPGRAVFEFGLSEAYTGATDAADIPAGFGGVSSAGYLTGLTPGVEYHYRLVVSNAVGVVTGGDRTFLVPALFVPGDANGDGRVDQAELDAVLAHYWPYSPWPTMSEVSTWGEGTFQFALTDATSWDFRVEVATNLVDWQFLGPATPVFQFRDPAATNEVQRFYRLRWP